VLGLRPDTEERGKGRRRTRRMNITIMTSFLSHSLIQRMIELVAVTVWTLEYYILYTKKLEA
jgi:hypothetical protein